MPTVGEHLRRAREARGLSLADLAEQTKISRFYLEALEANQPERLPGPFFYKAFVKQYCKALNLDARQFQKECVDLVGEETMSLEELRQAKFPAQERDPIMRAANPHHSDLRFVAAAGALIGVLLTGSLVYTWMQKPDAPITVANQPQVSLPVGVKPVTEAPVMQPQQTSSAAPQMQTQQQQQPAPEQFSAITPVATDANGVPVVNLTPNIGGSDAAVSLSISASEPTWLMILSDGKTLYQGILEPAQARVLAGRANAVVKVGNAAGIQVKWNGKQIGPLGERGQVRMIKFTDKEWQFIRNGGDSNNANPQAPSSNDGAPSGRKIS